MYNSPPSVVIGFHGCEEKIAQDVVSGNLTLRKSQNIYDWLGHGLYFWEGNPDRALDWAKKKNTKKPAALGAVLKLGNCLNLLDNTHINLVKQSYEDLKAEMAVLDLELPINRPAGSKDNFLKLRELDCRVVEYLHLINETAIGVELKFQNPNWSDSELTREMKRHPDQYDSVRGMFPEGDLLYPGAGFRLQNHIQVCIRNPNCVLGYFLPRDVDKKYSAVL